MSGLKLKRIVSPLAAIMINARWWSAVAASAGREEAAELQAISSTLGSATPASLERIERQGDSWLNYPLGVLREIASRGVSLPSIRIAIDSSLPFGAGVSSSAALEIATAEAVFELCGGRPSEPMDEARLCQRAERDFVGIPCGLLDQFSSLFGRANHLLYLDCRSLEWDRAPLHEAVAIVIADTQAKHALVDRQYARVRAHCESAREKLAEKLGRPLATLRDATFEEFEAHAASMDVDDRRRARHVFAENERVRAARKAASRGDTEALGSAMVESHGSSRDLLGNSCAELDAAIEIAAGLSGFLGGKLSGGGFGGATVNLVERASVEEFCGRIASEYARRFPTPLRLFVTSPGDGAGVV